MQWQCKCACCGEPIDCEDSWSVCDDCAALEDSAEPETVETIWGTIVVGGKG